MKRIMLGLPLALLLVSACSKTNDYIPAADASGEDIFKSACIGCHQPKQGGHYFELDQEMANATVIATKIGQGSFAMPAFANIQGDALRRLSEYVLSQSRLK